MAEAVLSSRRGFPLLLPPLAFPSLILPPQIYRGCLGGASVGFLICGFQHLFILFILWLLSTSMWNYLLMRDEELLMWNLTRGICTRAAKDICAGIQ